MKLIAINKAGEPETPIKQLPEMARDILQQTASLYSSTGYAKPWIGYFAHANNECIGFCAFKSPPKDNAVEIAYATMAGHEGFGIATNMARLLIDIARRDAPKIAIRAQTLPEENASTTILRKLGFQLIGEVIHTEDGRVWEWRLENKA